ncbi:hypothetical protein PUN28_013654 [Cardiocondyla obscurior]|uniref:Uncharacterized protein n=1 Tax=Cardiocondyla obscurior TaxID=286306 RepID=A0AAW2F7M0_9HYME
MMRLRLQLVYIANIRTPQVINNIRRMSKLSRVKESNTLVFLNKRFLIDYRGELIKRILCIRDIKRARERAGMQIQKTDFLYYFLETRVEKIPPRPNTRYRRDARAC